MSMLATRRESFPGERWFSVGEIATYLGVKPDTIYKWIDRKNLPAHKVGRLWKFRVSEIDHWVKSGGAAENTVGSRSDT